MNANTFRIQSIHSIRPSDIANFLDINRFDQTRIIFGGDFNARYVSFGDRSNNINGNKLVSVINGNADLHLHYSDSPTCYKLPNGSFLDHLITDMTITQVNSVPLSFSDHCPIMTTFNADVPLQIVSSYKDYRTVNWIEFNEVFSEVFNDLQILTDTNMTQVQLDELSVNLNGHLTRIINKLAAKSENRALPPLNNTRKRLIRERRRLNKKLSSPRTPQIANNRMLGEIRQLTIMINNNIRSHNSKLFVDILQNTKCGPDTFKTIKRIAAYGKNPSMATLLFSDANKNVQMTGEQDIAESLAENFARNNHLTHLWDSKYDEVVSMVGNYKFVR